LLSLKAWPFEPSIVLVALSAFQNRMKRTARYRSAIAAFNRALPGRELIRALAITAMALAAGKAATLIWDSSGDHPTAPMDGSGVWTLGVPCFFNGTTDFATSSADIAQFGDCSTLASPANVIVGAQTIGGLVFDAAPPSGHSLLWDAASQDLSIGSGGIAVNTGAQATLVGNANLSVVLGALQSRANNSSNLLTVHAPEIANGSNLVTPDASCGGISTTGTIRNATGGVSENSIDSGAVTLIGTTTINLGTPPASGSQGGSGGPPAPNRGADLLPSIETVTSGGAVLIASDGATRDRFGSSVSLSDPVCLIGAYQAAIGSNTFQGAAYLFRNLDTATGTVTQNVKLTASDGATSDLFGFSVSQSGAIGLVGAPYAAIGSNSVQGAAYVYRNLDTASGTVTQNVKLTASDGGAQNAFGWSVSLSGTIGLVGAIGAGAYVFRNLDTASGTVTQNVKLTASDGAAGDEFGFSVILSDAIGMVGAPYATIGSNQEQGAAYLFRNLDTTIGTLTQDVKLTASDGAAGDLFGNSVSLSGSVGLAGAPSPNAGWGAAYLFRNLDTATGAVTQNVKLTASDAAGGNDFGFSVSLSGSSGLVGAHGATVGSNSGQGAAYLFLNLDTATGTVTQNVKLTDSDGAAEDFFGYSVSLDGDLFTIGAPGKNSVTGKAYTGSVSSLTTLDAGNTALTIGEISFVSQDNWIIGLTTSGNQVTLSAGNSANVTASGMGVYIGKNSGANNNILIIAGTLTANQITVGASGNTGNTLVVSGSISGSTTTVNSGSTLGGTGTVGAVTVQSGGQLEPGLTVTGPSAGTLTATGFTWEGGAKLIMELSTTSNASAELSLGTGVLTKGTAGAFAFDFLGGGKAGQTYDLINFGSTTFTTASQFTATDPAGGTFILTGNELLYIAPEPSAWATLAWGVGLLIGLRRFPHRVRT